MEEDTYKRDRLEEGKGVKKRKFVDMEGGKQMQTKRENSKIIKK